MYATQHQERFESLTKYLKSGSIVSAIACAVLSGGVLAGSPASAETFDAAASTDYRASVSQSVGYELADVDSFAGREIRLWRNTSTGGLHGEIVNAAPGDNVFLKEGTITSGPPQAWTRVPPGATSASTVELQGSYKVCGSLAGTDGSFGKGGCTQPYLPVEF